MRRILALAALALLAYTAPAHAWTGRPISVKTFNILKGNAADSITFATTYTSRAIPVAGAKHIDISLIATSQAGAGIAALADSAISLQYSVTADTATGFKSITPTFAGVSDDTTQTIFYGVSATNVLSGRVWKINPQNGFGYPAGIKWLKVFIRTKNGPAAGLKAAQSLKTVKLRVFVYRDTDESPHYESVPDIVGR